ncbi:initiation factor 2 [Trametopsis cervina]|nr:initiation factor 2 [Trametopsis cervina]
MHRARRSLQITQRGARSAATAAKIAPRDLGKWSKPDDFGPTRTTGKPTPSSQSKWARPSQQESKWPRPPSRPPSGHGDRARTPGPSHNPRPLPERSRPMPTLASSSTQTYRQADRTAFRGTYVPATDDAELIEVEETDPNQLPTEHNHSPRPPSRRFGADKSRVKGVGSREPRDDGKRRAVIVDVGRRGRAGENGHDTLAQKDVLASQVHVEKTKTKKAAVPKAAPKVKRDIFIPSIVSVGNLAKLLNVRLDRLQRRMVQAGMGDHTSHDHMLNSEYASLIAMEFGRDPIVNDEAAFDIYAPPEVEDRSQFPIRPPVVTIMGHVDHGKTTLLDTLRSASVAAGEAGGITQHIGAFSVDVPSEDPTSPDSRRSITFLDTPGHAAFSAMRARGASVTDVVVLVVAADDGIMPQTREVLDLVKKEEDKVALIVAINKVDKPGVDIDEVERALLAADVQLETFGGDVPVVHVSGLTGHGLPQLIETISLIAEMRDLRTEETGPVQGYVLESKVDKGLGPIATILVRRGKLTPGMHLICGTVHCRVRLLTSPNGGATKSVGPGGAAVVTGWKEIPPAGEEVLSGSESDIKRAITNRRWKAELEANLKDLDSINDARRAEREDREAEGTTEPVKAAADAKKELRLLIKGDVSGTVEAVAGCLQGIGNHLTGVNIIATGVGPVTESDVMRARASQASIVAFSVNTPRPVKNAASTQNVPIIESDIIYRLMDQIKDRVLKLLPALIETRVSGEATVVQLFEIKVKAKEMKQIAGCRVLNGAINKTRKARVIRGGETIHIGTIETLRHLKADMTEVSRGLECGIAFEGWDQLQPGDTIQVFQEVEVTRTL